MLPLLILGVAAAALIAHRAKISALWKAKFSSSDFKFPSADSFSGEGDALPAAAMTNDALLKLAEKLDRQFATLEAPLALLLLSNGSQAAFYEAESGSDQPVNPSARSLICDAMKFAEEAYGGGSELYISPMRLDEGGVQWVAGFVITNGPAESADFAPGAPLEGCILAGDLETLRKGRFC